MDRSVENGLPHARMTVSYAHASLLELFRRREPLAVELLTGTLGIEVPSWTEVRVAEGDLGQGQRRSPALRRTPKPHGSRSPAREKER